MRLKIDWTSLLLGRKFTVFICFTLYLTEISKFKPPGGGLYLEGRFNGGFLRYEFGGLIFGGAYTWRGLFLEFYGIWRELPTLYFEFNWKTKLFAKRVRTNIGRVTAKTYSGDRHFHNVRYFNILNV